MEVGLTIGLVAVVGLAIFWVWHAAGSEQKAEAFKGQNEALTKRAADLNAALLRAAEEKAREDRLNADALIRDRDAAGARDMLRDAQGRKPN